MIIWKSGFGKICKNKYEIANIRDEMRIWGATGPLAYLSAGKGYRTDHPLKITWHLWDNWDIMPSQHGFMKIMFCLTNLISYDRDLPGGWGKDCWYSLFRLQQRLWHYLPHYFPVEAGRSWIGQVHSLLGKERAEWPGEQSGGEWS